MTHTGDYECIKSHLFPGRATELLEEGLAGLAYEDVGLDAVVVSPCMYGGTLGLSVCLSSNVCNLL